MRKRKIVKCFRDDIDEEREITNTEFEKWRKSLNLERADKLMPIARVGWLAALKWLKTQERITDGEYNVIDVRVIDKEIAAVENKK